jgi:hypothetical protein
MQKYKMFVIENNMTCSTNFNQRTATILYDDEDDDTNTNTNKTMYIQSHSPQERTGQRPQTPEPEEKN